MSDRRENKPDNRKTLGHCGMSDRCVQISTTGVIISSSWCGMDYAAITLL